MNPYDENNDGDDERAVSVYYNIILLYYLLSCRKIREISCSKSISIPYVYLICPPYYSLLCSRCVSGYIHIRQWEQILKTYCLHSSDNDGIFTDIWITGEPFEMPSVVGWKRVQEKWSACIWFWENQNIVVY